MNVSLKIIQIGNSLGVILPKEALAALNVERGDVVTLTSAPEGFRLTPNDPVFQAQMEAARKIMKKRRNALHELSK